MSQGSRVVSIGCATHRWRESLLVNAPIEREIRADVALARLLERRLVLHDRALPRLLGRGKQVVTQLWRDGETGSRAVISTICHRNGRLYTSVHYEWEGR